MQPLVLHPPSLTTAQFGQPRFTGPGLPLNRSWSNARGCSPRAPLSRQSMSGSPSTEPLVTSGESKPPTYPPVPVPAGLTAAEPLANPPGLSHPSVINEPPSAPVLPRYGEPTIPPGFTSSPRLPPGAPQYPLSTLDAAGPGPSTRSLTQKSTRRTKAHVASACVNCKKKHLGCDPARPCRRCVLAGKASSCVDVTHKKRGRPPLKAEDSSLRSFSTHMDNPAVPAEVQPPGTASRGVLHRATSSRELRPMTDLQVGETGPAAAAMRVPRGQPHRWSASVFPLTRPMDPSPGAPGTASRRPFSSSGPPSYAPTAHPPPAFVPITSGFNPVLKPGVVPPGMERRYPPYPGPALPPPTSPQQHHLPAGVHYLPYAETPGSSMHHPIPDPRLPPGPREPYLESPLRLPPIHQATASPGPPGPPPGPPPGHSHPVGPHHAHRLSDPYPTSWTASAREESMREPRSPAPFPGPMGSMFSHTHQRSLSNAGPLDPIPRHLGPIDLPSPVPLGQSPISVTQAPPSASTETENSEPRPVKRRKMALDDMVNG